ncbi:MAG: alkaline phosphatase family protein [Clostridia bacterium]|nr:alkaline phosphatase family protein [Clostridia bacterium]
MKNQNSLDTLCAALCDIIGIEAPEHAAAANTDLLAYAKEILGDTKADRILMYNPDAIAQWISEKYEDMINIVKNRTDLELPMATVMPSVTPVCFGTMYTGAQPAVHGIQSYTKPVIKIDTIFDALIRAGKKPALIAATSKCSLANIYLERNMDYFICGSIEEVNAKAAELIIADEHDFILVYNGNYDAFMHKFGPEAPQTLAELRANARTFGMIDTLVQNHWKSHNTLIGFAMDHGCHEIDGGAGSHGLNMDEDINIKHFYKIHKKQA